MNQEKINKINDVEFELMYNSLFGNPLSVSSDKSNNRQYVNFLVNHLITGDTTKLQSVELNKQSISNVLQERKAKVLEGIVLNSSNKDLLFKNEKVAKTDIEENIKHAVNFPTKFVVMSQFMYSNLKPEIKSEMMRNFAKNVTLLQKQNLISEQAVNFSTEQMMNVDSRYKLMLANANRTEEAVMMN